VVDVVVVVVVDVVVVVVLDVGVVVDVVVVVVLDVGVGVIVVVVVSSHAAPAVAAPVDPARTTEVTSRLSSRYRNPRRRLRSTCGTTCGSGSSAGTLPTGGSRIIGRNRRTAQLPSEHVQQLIHHVGGQLYPLQRDPGSC
jgi:hypothetical protein